jgi:GNAT superfamily N-acetyltransferase
MTTTIRVDKVNTADDFRAFFEFPWKVYRDDPNWIPPLLSMRRDLLDRKKNPAWDYMEGDYFVARRGDEVVGTIAAFVNHRHNEFQSENIGWFGAFESINDPDTATALLDTAAEWVRSRGYTAIRGPQTFTTHEEVGLLIDGFELPYLLMPYHHAYYQSLIEGSGFVRAIDMHSYYYDWDMVAETGMGERLGRLAQRLSERSQITLRTINPRNLKADFATFKDLYNRAWVANWGFVPMTERELDALIEGLGMIFEPSLACFAEIDGEAAGFIIVVPDFNQVLHAAYPRPGVPEPLTLLKVLWHWKLRPKINRARVPLMGVLPEHRKKGLDVVMYHKMIETMRASGKYLNADSGWILENNHAMVGILNTFGTRIHRHYRLYQKDFAEVASGPPPEG